MTERMRVTPEDEERRRLVLEALREDCERTGLRLAHERVRQRIAEAERAARLRELRLAREAAEARAKSQRSKRHSP